MYATELCGQPYEHNGDIRDCRLAYNHNQTCADANHQAFLDSLHTRTWEAQRKDPWL